jgi:Carboxypeptidase regulatory-like domain
MYIPALRVFPIVFLLLMPWLLSGQNSVSDSLPKNLQDSTQESRIVSFKVIGTNTSEKAIMQVTVLEQGDPEPIMGATVLMRRDKDKMLGKVSNAQGNCTFYALPASYTLRVQMTGLKSLEKAGILLEAGKTYQLEISMRKQ